MARKYVLVVEDEPLLRLNAVDIVEEAGFEAIEAGNSAQALIILESRSDIEIVFTDIEMPPGTNGIELASSIRSTWPPIEIVVTSGKYVAGEVQLPERCLFFSKPYRHDDVIAAIKSFAK